MAKTPLSIRLAKRGMLGYLFEQIPLPNLGPNVQCLGEDTETFFSEDPALIARAKAICLVCPVLQQCAEWAIRHEAYGVFGGLSPKERAFMRGGATAIDALETDRIRREVTYILGSTAKDVASRFGVDTRTVVRWRNILRPLKEVA